VAHTILALTQGTALRALVDPEGVNLERYFGDIRRTIILVVADRLRQAGIAPSAGAPR
jgi:hypothetical protein